MKKFGKYAALWLMAVLPVVSSCSDDDGPKKPSDEIIQVDIYKAEAGAFQIEAQYKMTYDGKDRISSVRTEYNSQESYRLQGAYAALSLVLMLLVFVCTGIMNRFGADEEGGVIA